MVVLLGCDKWSTQNTKPGFKGIDISGAEYARTLSLTDQYGKLRNLEEFKGKVSVVFFGYTQCPDVCPATMAELAQIKKALGKDGERLQGIFVTVDPKRDTQEILQRYMANFDPSFLALRGTPEQIKAAAQEFKVFFAIAAGKTETSYTVDHTAGSFVFDASGKVRVFVRYGSGVEALTADLKLLLAEA
ncbi:MAG: SCO family protein [Burkholderiaceae bacterium]